MLPIIIPPAISLGLTAAKIGISVLGAIGNRKRSSPQSSQMRIGANGMPDQLPNRKTVEEKKTRKEIRQERKENRNQIVH